MSVGYFVGYTFCLHKIHTSAEKNAVELFFVVGMICVQPITIIYSIYSTTFTTIYRWINHSHNVEISSSFPIIITSSCRRRIYMPR
jgi:hypothetical protein